MRMTLDDAINILEKARVDVDYTPEGTPLLDWHTALDIALAKLRDQQAHWRQQAEVAKRGGHGPGSDF